MADLSKITCPNGTTVDILSKTTRGIVRATMESTSTSTAFVVTAPGITSLYDGATFICKNTKVDSASGCTMDVNGLGAKGMWCSQSNTAVTTHWTKNYTYIWIYDATNERWEFYQGRDTDNNKMNKVNPTGSGHLALNQATGSTVGDYSVTEGFMCSAEGLYSHAEGLYTIAYADTQHVSGKFNEIDTGLQYAEIIGNGTDGNARSNARTLDWYGNESLLGNLKFMECDATTPVSNYPVNMTEPGIMWKEKGYGDKFEIKPKFYGNNDENKLMVNASYGAAGTDPDVATVMHIDPLGDFGFGRDVYETWWNFNCTSSTNNVKIKITFPNNNWAKYHVDVLATANFGYIHSRVFVGMDDHNSINQCGYTNETPTWTTVSGCSAVTNNAALSWTADKTNRIITSSAFGKYGMAMVRITSSINPVYNRIRVEKIDG